MPKKKKEKPRFELTFKTAAQILEERKTLRKIPTGTPIDLLLQGGIYEGELIELAGEYGVGKTQLCYSILCNINEPTVWIDAEDTFYPSRIVQIQEAKGLDPEEILSKIHLINPLTTEEQIASLDKLKDINPKLIIIDGLITLFRAEYLGRENLPKRQQQLLTFIVTLKRYLREQKAIAIETNQVMANPDQLPFMTYEQKVLILGGHTVFHAVNNRMLIRKARENKRIARLIDSAWYPPSEVVFLITEKGIEEKQEKTT